MKIILRDTRIKGVKPKTTDGCMALDIDKTMSLDLIMTTLASVSAKFDGFETIKILGHGYTNKDSRGGLGIEFSKDDITVKNVGKFAALKGKVTFIDVLSCAAADIQPGKEQVNGHGNGVFLCSQLAFHSGAIVVASKNIQSYNKGVDFFIFDIAMDFGDWEGFVLFFAPDGTVITSFSELLKYVKKLAGR